MARKRPSEDLVKPRDRRSVYLICALLIVITIAVYWRVATFDFINFDDEPYVKYNPRVAEGLTVDGIKWSLTSTYQSIWMPLVWISYMVDHDISSLTGSTSAGADPHVCHVTNVLLHIANSLLLFLCLRWMTGRTWLSAFVAAVFAVHPLRVESVAWIAERKDVLSTFFWMLTMLAYVRYVRRPGAWRYVLVAVAFALGLMAKPMLVALPIALLILDYWPLNRLGSNDGQTTLWGAVREKIPLLVLAGATAVLAVRATDAEVVNQGQRVVVAGQVWPFGERVANAFVSYAQYILMTFWPRDLAVFYPHPGHTLPPLIVAVSVLVLAALSLAAYFMHRIGKRYFAAGWLWYVVTLLPAIGFVQVGKAGIADRFTYVPSIGLLLIVGWGASELIGRFRPDVQRIAATGLGVAVVALLMCLSYVQVGHWRNSYELFTHTIRVTKPNAQARLNLGGFMQEQGKVAEAIRQFREALRIEPDNTDIMYSLACVLTNRGKTEDLKEAITLFQGVLKVAPGGELTHNYLGVALAKSGRLDDAIVHFEEALRLNPNRPEAQANLDRARALKNRGR